MNDDLKEREESKVALGVMAAQLLTNPAYVHIISQRKAEIFEEFSSSEQDQPEVREEAWRTMKNLDAILKHAVLMIDDGKMAEETLKLHTE